MTDTLFFLPDYPDSALDSIYALYPRKASKKDAVKRIREALDRICGGEIDGNPRTSAEAIQYLRERTEVARKRMIGREAKFIPHATTWYHQRRYLRPYTTIEELPKRVQECMRILSEYPKMPSILAIERGVESFLPALNAIDREIDLICAVQGISVIKATELLLTRTQKYAKAVSQWPESELQFVPNPKRFYEERRHEQPEQLWQRRNISNGYSDERQQINRILQ